jgi:hypothetical protein
MVIGVVVLFLVTCIAGCLKPDPSLQPPIGTYPKITVDFVDNVTKFYIEALTDVRYANMTIKAFKGNVTYGMNAENNTYNIHLTVKQKEFTLNTTVTDKTNDKIKMYAFEGNFTVRPSSDPSILLFISIYNPMGSPKTYKIQEADLPWSTIGDRIV